MGNGKRINSRDKGANFERDIAIMLRQYWPDARRGFQYRTGNETCDVQCTPYWIECKRLKKWTHGIRNKAIMQLLDNFTYCLQHDLQAKYSFPVLIYKADSEKIRCISMKDTLAQFKDHFEYTALKAENISFFKFNDIVFFDMDFLDFLEALKINANGE